VKHKSQAKNAYETHKHDVLGGKCIILRTAASGDVWQFRMWVSEEKKYVRKTLGTRDFKTAIERAETLYLQLYSDVASGKKIFGVSLGELIDQYLKWRREDVRGGKITAGRLVTLSSHLKHLKKYKGEETQISKLDAQSLFDYEQWRRTENAGAQPVTIRNEQATINHLMKFAYRNGYAHFEKFDFPVLKIREVTRRDTFTLDEYDDLVRYLRKWVSKEEVQDEARLERLMIRDCILIGSNTMLRVGELMLLKWGDVIGYKNRVDDKGRKVTLVTLNVRAETAKNRKSRLITCRGGEYFKRLFERTKFKVKSDFIFCGESGDERFSKKKFYAAWEDLMNGLGINFKKRNLTWYSLRHFGITCRLRAGASIFEIAKIAGTGVDFISQHYGHFDQSMSEAVALKNFTISKEGITVRD